MSNVRHFVILAGDEAHLALEHVGRKHGSVVVTEHVDYEDGVLNAILFESPCQKIVYGAVEFIPHPAEKDES